MELFKSIVTNVLTAFYHKRYTTNRIKIPWKAFR